MPERDKARGLTYPLKGHLTCKRTQHCWLTTPNIVGCYSCVPLHTLLHVAECYQEWLCKPSTPNISFVPYLQSETQQCWIRLHSSSNFVGASHAPKMAVEFKFTKSHGVVSFPLSTAGPNIVGFVASIYGLIHLWTQQSLYCWPNNVGSCCVRLPEA